MAISPAPAGGAALRDQRKAQIDRLPRARGRGVKTFRPRRAGRPISPAQAGAATS